MDLIQLLIYVVVLGLIVAVVWWGWGKVGPMIPQPFNMVIVVLGVLIICVLVINILLGLIGQPIFDLGLRRR